jgi:L-alanine-DL-glutamate epimerase-like enolase superfamily enzyme
MTPAQVCEVADGHLARGLRAVKPRASGTAQDAVVLADLRRHLPAGADLMIDANERCDLPRAQWLLAAARDHGALFVEEPLPATAVDGYRMLARRGGAPVAAGEHLQGPAFQPFIREGLAAVVQPDLAMAGGITPIVELAAVCGFADLAMAPHFLPGLFVHVAAAAPAIGWLEEFPLLEPLFEGWPALVDGTMTPTDRPGHGLSLAADARHRFAISEY